MSIASLSSRSSRSTTCRGSRSGVHSAELTSTTISRRTQSTFDYFNRDPKRLSRGDSSESAMWPTESGSSRRQKALKHGDRQCV